MEHVSRLIPGICFMAVTIGLAVFALTTPQFRAKGWLVAWLVISVVSGLWWNVWNLLLSTDVVSFEEYRGGVHVLEPAVGAVNLLGLACLFFFVSAQHSANGQPVALGRLLFSFSGRIPRRQFWMVELVLIAMAWFTGVPLMGGGDLDLGGNSLESERLAVSLVVYSVWMLFSLWPSLAVQVKRWHDRGKSGWMVLIALIPIVGPIWALVEVGFLRGTAGRNRYGDDPLRPTSEEQAT